jgi:hypothetical protein
MYYRLDGDSATLTTYVKAVNRTQESLVSGALIDEEDEDLPYVYTYSEPAGNPLPDFFKGSNIMSKKMYEAFTECGVDNIQIFPLQFIDKETDQVRDDYVVFNIVGMVECAKLGESEKLPLGGGFYFQNLIIDPAKTHDLLVFRLRESLMDIIVQEKVAKKLEEKEIRGIILTPATTQENL